MKIRKRWQWLIVAAVLSAIGAVTGIDVSEVLSEIQA